MEVNELIEQIKTASKQVYKELGSGYDESIYEEAMAIEHLDTYVKGDKLYRKFAINRVKQLRSSIIQNEISEIGKIKPVVREIDLNADNKRFWLGQLTKIDKSKNNSVSLSANHFQI